MSFCLSLAFAALGFFSAFAAAAGSGLLGLAAFEASAGGGDASLVEAVAGSVAAAVASSPHGYGAGPPAGAGGGAAGAARQGGAGLPANWRATAASAIAQLWRADAVAQNPDNFALSPSAPVKRELPSGIVPEP